MSPVDAVEPHDEQALRAQLEQARERLDGLVRDLHAVDHELEELSRDRRQYRLLEQVCGGLEELSEMGAAGLFWDARAGDGDDHVRFVRGRVDVFQKHVQGIEDRRQEVLDEIQLQQESADFLEDDLYELKRREEERKLEWFIERDIDPLPARAAVMPWTRAGEDDDRFRKALAASLLLSMMLGLLLPMIDLPLPDSWEVTEVPDRLTSLIRDELPPPPPPVQEQTKPEEPDPEEPLLAEETAPKPTPEKTAESKGILAFREKFSGLAASKAPARLGSDARITSSAEAEVGRPTRNMVATQAPGSSGGINLASLSRGVGGGNGQDMQGVQVTRVTSSIGGVAGEDRPLSSGLAAGRTDEEIQIVFDRHKAALYRLYNRELRRDPTLKGQMVLRIRIEPDGSVSLCQLQSTDMKAPQLASQVVDRVKTFDFGAKDGVPTMTILYPIDFLPAT
jgi:hypothetical protein